MTTTMFMVGAAVAAALLSALIATFFVPSLRIWPTPGPGSWQSYVFWPLFRSLNALCFVVAYLNYGNSLGLPLAVRAIAFLLLGASLAIFIYAFRLLGRDNSYGASDGLVTSGIYQWTRNPQNAMLIVVYACLAIAADSKATYILSIAMMAVYALMVLLEEPWLEKVYGDTYRSYCAEVPRFFHWKRLIG
ncbi:MAG: isoprenylcysteine carboxylmethyltransferase family protein [Hyphomicrobiaceae bacterium]|nr:isoprenylcysteine carboxylmethyltransferase family protein [Hyphomicrobiaceae bacterium]